MIELKINSNNGFLNLEDLPHNCIFNKVVTGCGGTTIVLFNDESYVIAVPTTELIINKTGKNEAGVSTIQFGDKIRTVFGLFGSFTNSVKSQLKKYLAGEGIKKIICTYDKLPKLNEFLNPADYRLLVDEYHSLLKAYSYRDKAIDGVLNSFRKYKSYCFMSATPIQADFKPRSMEDIEEVVADWDEVDQLIVRLEKTNKPYVKAANIIKAYKTDGFIEINGLKSYEAFFFINSVTDIASILQHCELTNDEVKIVCADNESNRTKLAGYTISNSRSENKKFTFITSKSFEGADYFSDTAMCFVVSSPTNTHTLAGIDTDIPQIAGRIRTKTNPFRNVLVHIFNTTRLNLDVTYEEMIERTNKEIAETEATVNLFNNADELAKNHLRRVTLNRINDFYMSYDANTDTFSVNDLLPKLELYNYHLNQVIYNKGLSLVKAYNQNGILTTDVFYERIDDTMSKAGKKISFKDAFLRYAELVHNMVMTTEVDTLAEIQPLIVPAYHRLGIDKVKKLRYVKSAVEDALNSLDADKNKDTKIAMILSKKVSIGFNKSADLKNLITEAYKTVGCTDKVKASSIDRWFECDPTSKRIDGKVSKGYIIYRPKMIFK